MAKMRADTVSVFLDLIANAAKFGDSGTAFDELYAHPDYATEIERYASRGSHLDLNPSALAASLPDLLSGNAHAAALELHPHSQRVLRLVSHFESYMKRWDGFLENWQNTLSQSRELARQYLPSTASIPDVDVLVTVGLGDSFGWPYKDVIHFDFIKMLDDFETFSQLQNLLAHELHHIGFESLLLQGDFGTSTRQFLLFLAYEGTAIKFFNHPDSVFSPCLNTHLQNYQIVAADWHYYREHWDYYLRQFQRDYRTLLEVPGSDVASVIKRWMTDERVDCSARKLSQYPNYFLGSEIVGLLFDRYGLQMLFDVLFGSVIFEDVYDSILDEKGLSEFKIRS